MVSLNSSGPMYVILAAMLFGVSPALVKVTIGEMSPLLVAGLLYLGSAVGLTGWVLLSKGSTFGELNKLSTVHRYKLLGAIVAGGILGPICLVYGIKRGTAFEVSLLLNLETFTTTALAWLVFREHVGRSVWLGKLLLILGGIVISYDPKSSLMFSAAGGLVFLACLFWGIDNNLTRDVDELSPAVLASTKGWVAGSFNVILALLFGLGTFTVNGVEVILTLGAFSYGLSLVFFVLALRSLGSARTSTYFAIGPFFGMFFSLVLLGERPATYQWVAAIVMGIGLWVLSRESHGHTHTHEVLHHKHRHTHDQHHQHEHEGWEGSEPHEHPHAHNPLMHSHPHLPDIHHRHEH